MLYGDISTADQLDFMDEKYMRRLEQKYNCTSDVPYANQKLPYVKPEVKELLKLKKLDKSVFLEKTAPEQGATGNLAVIAKYTGRPDMEKYFLGEVLLGKCI